MASNTEADYYAALELKPDATDAQIKKAYRQLALKFHPDKNPDEAAIPIFQRISKAYEILSDPKAKAAFDALFKLRHERERQLAEMDKERRRARDELIDRENQAKKRKWDAREAEERFQQELDRLRAEGAKLQQERERELADLLASDSSDAKLVSEMDRTVKVKWKKKHAFDVDQLREVFTMLGRVEHLIVSSKGNSALIVFETLPQAHYVVTKKNVDERLSKFSDIQWASGKESDAVKAIQEEKASTSLDFETATLLRMQQRMSRDEKRKQFLSEMMKQ